uniref:Uncharacterized protein n=1 Tax=Bos indicus x Bos taurus TaxID=30522 RepID=A0A4W2F231_BOBOX
MSDTCSLFPPFGDPWPSCLLPSQYFGLCDLEMVSSCQPSCCTSSPCQQACCEPICCTPVCCRPVCYTPVCCRPVCCRPICCTPVCCRPVCCTPVCCRPVCCTPVCCRPVCCEASPCSCNTCLKFHSHFHMGKDLLKDYILYFTYLLSMQI